MSEVQLNPPIGTCYFKSYEQNLKTSTDILNATLTVTFYIYVTLAKPDKNFTAKGGKVYIIAVYHGRIKNVGKESDIFGFTNDTDNLRLPPRVQLPVAGTEQINGDTRIYTIDFTQTMSMYSNDGNSTFNFSARYKHPHVLTGYRQTKYEVSEFGHPTAGWSLVWDDSAKTHDETCDTYGLQIYETNTLAAPKCSIIFGHISSNNSTVLGRTFILDYSAETMANAVVGSNTIGIHSPMPKPSEEGQSEWFIESHCSSADADRAST